MGNHSGKTLTKADLKQLTKTTKFTREELMAWYKEFHEDYPNGKMTREEFIAANSKVKKGDEFWGYLFDTFDVDSNGFIDFKEFVTGMSIGMNGTPEEKLEWAFKLYDIDGNGYIEYEEMLCLVSSLFKMMGAVVDLMPADQRTPEARVKKIFELMDENGDGKLTMEEFVKGCKKDSSILQAMSLS